jgi:hydrogenase nickel incorporation protein HypA/HybF
MHEHALMADLVHKIEQTALDGGAERVTAVTVTLGALSHFTPTHFREHFLDATRGTIAEGATVLTRSDEDINAPHADGVILESVELEVPDPAEAV